MYLVNHRNFRLASLLVAALLMTASPCIAALPVPPVPCPMMACGNAPGASFDSVRPCCCDGSARPILPVAGVSLGAPLTPSLTPPTTLSGASPTLAIAALDGAPHAGLSAPLFLLHASLLI